MDFKEILHDNNIQSAKVAGAILDIKERSNKDGKKYAFITVSDLNNQYEMSIFNDNIVLYKPILKEGNTLLFHVDASNDNENLRIIIRKIEDLEITFIKDGDHRLSKKKNLELIWNIISNLKKL